MACLDTDFLLDLAGRGGAVRQDRALDYLRQLRVEGATLTTTRFNVAELLVGVFRGGDELAERRKLDLVLSSVLILDFTGSAAEAFAEITAVLLNQGTPVGDMGVLIAAVCLIEGEPLVTHNTRHFARIPGLTVLSY